MKTFARGLWNFHTLTWWESKEKMLEYRNSGAHLLAMKLSRKMGQGYTVGWESVEQPTAVEGEARLKNKLQLSGNLAWL